MLSSATLIVNNESGINGKDGGACDPDTTLGVTAARKLAAAQKRAARKAARGPRMFSESTYEYPTKGILKHKPLPKRSVSECVDDISQIMDELNIELSEYDQNRIEELNNSGSDSDGRPKKSVRFNEEVYETLFIASCLYDRRNFAKIHFSTRHHPPPNQAKKSASSKKKESKKGSSSKSKNKKKTSSESGEYTDTSSDDQSSGQEDNTNSSESSQYGGDSFSDLQSSLGNKMSKHNRKENREKKSTNLRLIQDDDNNNDDIFNSNSNKHDIKSSDPSIKNGLSKQVRRVEDEDTEMSAKKPPRRSTIDSGYDSTEEENCPWTTVRKGRKRWNSASA